MHQIKDNIFNYPQCALFTPTTASSGSLHLPCPRQPAAVWCPVLCLYWVCAGLIAVFNRIVHRNCGLLFTFIHHHVLTAAIVSVKVEWLHSWFVPATEKQSSLLDNGRQITQQETLQLVLGGSEWEHVKIVKCDKQLDPSQYLSKCFPRVNNLTFN